MKVAAGGVQFVKGAEANEPHGQRLILACPVPRDPRSGLVHVRQVLLRLLLVGYFYDITSERRLLEAGAGSFPYQRGCG